MKTQSNANSLPIASERLPADIIEAPLAREIFTPLEVRLIELVADGEPPREAGRALGLRPLDVLVFFQRPDVRLALQLERDALTLGTHSALANKVITSILQSDDDDKVSVATRARTAIDVLKLAQSITPAAPKGAGAALELKDLTAEELEQFVNERRRTIDVAVTELAAETAVTDANDLF